MGLPEITDIKPEIRLDRDDIISLLLASIALEEISLAHILNAEAEKLQFALGTLDGHEKKEMSKEDLLILNKNVNKTLRNAVKMEMLLLFKLEDIIDLIEEDDEDDEG